MADQYYRFFPGDYQRDTGDLSLVEHGAYRVLLDHYYTQECLPADKEKCYRIARAFTQAEQAAVDNIIKRFFRADGDVLRNKKADKEIIERKAFIDAQSERGKRGAAARWNKENSMAGAMAQALPEQWPDDGLPSPSPSKRIKNKERGDKSPRFTPPTQDEVKNYCTERNNSVNSQQFYDFYSAKDWMIGKNKMRDWRAAVRTWEQREDNSNGGTRQNNNTNWRTGPAVHNDARTIADAEEANRLFRQGIKAVN